MWRKIQDQNEGRIEMLGRHCEVVRYHIANCLYVKVACARQHFPSLVIEVRLAKILCLKLEQNSGSCM